MVKIIKDHPFRVILVALLVIIGVCLAGIWVAEMPRYITFGIPSPDQSNIELADWVYEEYSTLKYIDGNDKFFLWRTQADFYGSIPNYRFDSLEGVLRYLDDYLKSYGWKRVGEYSTCSRLTERNFVEDDEIYKYIEIENDDEFSYRIVCVLIWQRSDYMNTPAYRVTLASINPSFLTEIRYAVR
jgi:hypothetical protein